MRFIIWLIYCTHSESFLVKRAKCLIIAVIAILLLEALLSVEMRDLPA